MNTTSTSSRTPSGVRELHADAALAGLHIGERVRNRPRVGVYLEKFKAEGAAKPKEAPRAPRVTATRALIAVVLVLGALALATSGWGAAAMQAGLSAVSGL